VDGETLGFDQAAERLARAFVELGVHEPRGAVDHNGGCAELFSACSRFEAEEAAADGDCVDLAAELLGEFGDRLVDGPHVLEGAVDVHVLRAGDRQAGGVRTGGHHQFVEFVGVAGCRLNGLGSVVDLDDAFAGLQGQGIVVPHGSGAEGEVHVAVGERLAEGHPVVGEVGFLGEDRDMPAFEAAGMHCVRKTVGRGAAAGDDDAARSLGA
jgi:hypothetical protein